MSGRGRMPRRAFQGFRGAYADRPAGPSFRGPVPHPPHPAVLEEELELQRMEIQRLLADNCGLIEDRAAFERELLAVREELHRLNMVITDVHADKEAHTRDLIGRELKLEADLRATEPVRNEVIQLRADLQNLNAVRQELTSQVQSLTQELKRAQADNQQISSLRTEMESLRQELMHARTAFEYEKKAKIELMEQRQVMQNNLVSMANEVDKLRADLANTEGRHWGGSYGASSPQAHFPSSYGDRYDLPLGVTDKAPLYGPASGSWGALDKSRLARH